MADYEKPVLHGITASGNKVPIKVTDDGTVLTNGGGGGGGSADFGTAITGQTLETGGVGNLGWLSSIRKLISERLPPRGANTAANSLPVTLSTDGQFAQSFGQTSDAAATSDTGNFGLIALFKRFLSNGSRLLDAAGTIQATIKAASSQPVLTDTGLVVSSRDLAPVEFNLTGTAINTNMASGATDVFDVTGFSYFSIQFTGGNAAILVQATMDTSSSTFWQELPVERTTSSATGASSSSTFSASISTNSNFGIHVGKVTGKFLRFRITSTPTGTITAILQLHRIPKQHDTLKNITGNIVVSSINNPISINPRNILANTGVINTLGDNTIISAPGSGQTIRLTSLQIQADSGASAVTVIAKNGASTNFDSVFCPTPGDGKLECIAPGFEYSLSANTALILNLSAATPVRWSAKWYVS